MKDARRRILTVSELTQGIKELLESSYPFVWVAGEISNFRVPLSGHYYFSLKDAAAQISAVMFRGQNRSLKFKPHDGMAVVAMGRLNLYETKGIYQIIVEYLEPEGIGVLQLAFEQLKARLAAEGLFDQERKKALCFLPRKIAVVTSPTGSVIRDILNILHRRFPGMPVDVAPVKVQGQGASEEIAGAVALINEMDEADVIIVARGGGSLEDLQAFNSEIVARAIFASHIPVVSAIGHETDFTIADFVADLRAPTPSAAAELVVPVRDELIARVDRLAGAMKQAVSRMVRLFRERVDEMARRLGDPAARIADHRLRLDDTTQRMVVALNRQVREMGMRLNQMEARVRLRSPVFMAERLGMALEHQRMALYAFMRTTMASRKQAFNATEVKLNALSPLAILRRGYSITRTLPDLTVVKDVDQVDVGRRVEVTVSKGSMCCMVEGKQGYGQTDI